VAEKCAVCGLSNTSLFSTVDDFEYYECQSCESIAVCSGVVQEIDSGSAVRTYDETYWRSESISAISRSWGWSLARVAEIFLYARIDVHRFLDIGTGGGHLLDSLATYLPDSKSVFWGVELYPPPVHSMHEHYRHGSVSELEGTFQAGLCMEVVEHLTPIMLSAMLKDLSDRSDCGAIYMFNTGLPAYVKHSDPKYLDPLRRGHIVSYGLPAIAQIAAPFGFTLSALPGRDWAYVLEYRPEEPVERPLAGRIWSAREHNKKILRDSKMGNLMYVLGIDTARAYT
jgi:hypothetical protein